MIGTEVAGVKAFNICNLWDFETLKIGMEGIEVAEEIVSRTIKNIAEVKNDEHIRLFIAFIGSCAHIIYRFPIHIVERDASLRNAA